MLVKRNLVALFTLKAALCFHSGWPHLDHSGVAFNYLLDVRVHSGTSAWRHTHTRKRAHVHSHTHTHTDAHTWAQGHTDCLLFLLLVPVVLGRAARLSITDSPSVPTRLLCLFIFWVRWHVQLLLVSSQKYSNWIWHRALLKKKSLYPGYFDWCGLIERHDGVSVYHRPLLDGGTSNEHDAKWLPATCSLMLTLCSLFNCVLCLQDICKSLWCHRTGHRCETKFMPAAEGTSCGPDMVRYFWLASPV